MTHSIVRVHCNWYSNSGAHLWCVVILCKEHRDRRAKLKGVQPTRKSRFQLQNHKFR